MASVSVDQGRRLAVHPAVGTRADVEEAEVEQVVVEPRRDHRYFHSIMVNSGNQV